MSIVMEQHERWLAAHKRLTGDAPTSSVPELRCPCCGHEIEANGAALALACVDLPPAPRKLLNMVCAAYPKAVRGGEIVAGLWAGLKRPPATRIRIMTVYGHKINAAIRPYGWEVQAAYLDSGSRRLVRVKPSTTERLSSAGTNPVKPGPAVDARSQEAV